jgi:hypothetical protein
MSKGISALVAMALASGCCGADLVLADGRVLKEYRVVNASAGFVTVAHKTGLVQVPKALLPEDLRRQFPTTRSALETERQRFVVRKSVASSSAQYVSESTARPIQQPIQQQRPSVEWSLFDAAVMSDAQKRYAAQGRYPSRMQIEEREPVQGWPGRYRISGRAFFDVGTSGRKVPQTIYVFSAEAEAVGGRVVVRDFASSIGGF